MLNIGEAATRKLGPLPTWAWAGVVGVGVLAVRSLGRGGAAGHSSGTQTTIGGDGAGFGVGDLPDAGGGGGSGGADGVPTATVGGDGLPGVIGQFSSAFTLQQQLNDALAKLSELLGTRSTVQNQINTTKIAINKNLDDYRDGKISKSTYDSRLATFNKSLTSYNTQLSTVNTQITSQNGLITDLKARLTAIFAAPAAA